MTSRAIFVSSLVIWLVAVCAGCPSSVTGPNRPPVAYAGADQSVLLGMAALLNGSGSIDPDDDALTRRWELVAAPTGGTAEIADPTGETTTFVADRAGVWMIRLTVNDGEVDSIPDVVQVLVTSQPCTGDAECDDANPCTDDACDNGSCRNQSVEDGRDCDDGLYCTDSDVCTTGLCAGHDRDCSQVEDDCNGSSCNEEADRCEPVAAPDGTGCDDGRWCTLNDTCQAGTCRGSPRDCSHAAAECVAGVCDEATRTCVGRPMAEGELCDDGQYCTVNERCAQGSCENGTARDCTGAGGGCVNGVCDEASDACIGDPLPLGAVCDDDQFCTDNDACDGEGNCGGTVRNCTALDNACNLGACDEETRQCVSQPANEGSGCDDGLFCTAAETCQGGACLGGPTDCDDQDPCTQDSCAEAADRCNHLLVANPGAEGPPADSTCTDGADNDCDRLTDGADPDCRDCTLNIECDDHNPCTVNTCVDFICATALEPDGTLCDDSVSCTDTDTCSSGVCAGSPIDCTGLDDDCNQGFCDEDAGGCVAQPVNGGGACDDGAYCNVNETCQGGSCTGAQARDCSYLDDTCNMGQCNETDDRCDQVHVNPGGACDDGLYCTVGDTCQAGSCQGGGPRDCSAAADPCNDGLCDEDSDVCYSDPLLPGTPCDNGDFCDGDDTCNGTGGCLHAGDPCFPAPCDEPTDTCQLECTIDADCPPGDLCYPACSARDDGCLTPPTSMTLGCTDPVDLESTFDSDCVITLAGGDATGQAACLACTAEVGLVVVDESDFGDDTGGCDLDGWRLVPGESSGDFCRDTVEDCVPADGDKDCCDDFGLICTTELGGFVLKQDKVTDCGSKKEEWRLEKDFDFSGLTDVRVCFDLASRGVANKDGIIVQAYDGSDSAEVFCHVDTVWPGRDELFVSVCTNPIPAWAEDNPAVTLRFIVHSEADNHAVFLDNVSVAGWGGGCAEDYPVVLDDAFDSCGMNDWDIAGDPNCPAFDCSNHAEWSPGIEADHDTVSMTTNVDASELDASVIVCFQLGTDGTGTGDVVSLQVNTGSGFQEAWRLEGDMGQDGYCDRLCVGISEPYPAVLNHPNLLVRFRLESVTGKLQISRVEVIGARLCPASGQVTLSSPPVETGPGEYDFTATDSWGNQLGVILRCAWDPDATLGAKATVRYLLPLP